MDWVHCNNCFLLPDNEKNFFLTSCGHIYCNDCEGECARVQCKLCGNQCTTYALSSSMKPDVQVYFTDPDNLLKKKLREVNQVSEFQKNHRTRLMAHRKKQLKKFEAVKDDFRKLLRKLKDIDNNRKQLSKENDMLKRFISTLQRSHYNDQAGTTSMWETGHTKSLHRDTTSPHSVVDSVLSKFIDNFGNRNSRPDKQERVSVISPPINGKLGIIKGTPSPSSAMQQLNLASVRSNESVKKTSIHFDTPNSTPGSSFKAMNSPFVASQNSTMGCPLDSYHTPPDQNKYKRDVKKMIVHPFSPED